MAKRAKAADDAPAPKPKTGGLDATARVALLHGNDSFLRSLHTAALRKALEKAHKTIDTVVFDGNTASAADVLDECRSFGLIAGYKLVVVDNADQIVKEANRPLFERYCESVAQGEPPGATLLLRAGTWYPGNLDKLIAEVGAVVKCDEPGEREAVGWVSKRAAKEYEAAIAEDAADLLVARVGTNLGRLDSELAKLVAAAGGQEIDRALVIEFVGASREEAAWGIQSTLLGATGPAEALGHLRYLLDVSRQPSQAIAYAFTDLARKLHAMSRTLQQGGTAQ
ncbi:MAG: hypothetical protein WC718_19480, partial [Phycisphaerales bacterium]